MMLMTTRTRTAAVAVALMCLSVCVNAESTKVELVMTFEAHPTGTVNHCPPVATTMMQTSIEDGKVVFNAKAAPATNAPALVWTSETVGQKGNTWNEIGNLTLIDATGAAQGAVNFKSFGYSGTQGPTISFEPTIQYGAITYQITDGSGVWAGAQGIMTDSFVATGNATSFPINGWAIFWVPTPSPSP